MEAAVWTDSREYMSDPQEQRDPRHRSSRLLFVHRSARLPRAATRTGRFSAARFA